ncbi:MAG TPA: winged helix-turn-helix domain-containing protein [Chloroflexota bacterium]|nr:winged helix-turn-helix domain-containing protein [Chloroflexota bacterium]
MWYSAVMRGKQVQVDWQDDEAALKRAYQSESDAQIKPRLHLLWLVRQGHQVQQAASLVGVHCRTAQQWMAWYREGGLLKVRSQRRGNARGKAPRLSVEQKQALVAKARSDGFVSVWEGVRFVEERFGIDYSYSGMNKVFAALGLRKKVPRPRNAKADESVQRDYQKGG